MKVSPPRSSASRSTRPPVLVASPVSMRCTRQSSRALAVEAVHDLEGDGVALVDVDPHRVHGRDGGADEEAALGEEVARDGGDRAVAAGGLGPPPPGRIEVAGDEHLDAFVVEEVEV